MCISTIRRSQKWCACFGMLDAPDQQPEPFIAAEQYRAGLAGKGSVCLCQKAP